jgi:hypothetical protein
VNSDLICRERGARVEAEPTEPKDSGPSNAERDRVWRHPFPWPSSSPTEHEDKSERGKSRIDLDNGAAREVEHTEVG